MRTLPHLSVIVPCHNAAAELRQCLAALAATRSDVAAEFIVVDDGSTDDSAEVALSSPLPVRLLRMSRRSGPYAARNAAARAATGNILVFLDADITVHADTLARISAAFADPALGAVVGSYDERPAAHGFYSQYRNLLHSFTHQTARRETPTFWTGCGAIRRDVFWAQGGFDETPGTVDDIDLGGRAARGGVKIDFDREIQVTHHKPWTMLSTLRTDLLLRGVPWTLMILRDRRMPNALNVNVRNRFSVALVWLALLFLALVAKLHSHPAVPLELAFAGLGSVIYLNRKFYRLLGRARGATFALRGVAAHLLYFFLCGVSFLLGVGLFAAARALDRPIPCSFSGARAELLTRRELPSYASGD